MGEVTERAWLEAAIDAEACAALFGISAARFLRTRACLPSFPVPVNGKPKAWIRREVLQWRDDHRTERAAA